MVVPGRATANVTANNAIFPTRGGEHGQARRLFQNSAGLSRRAATIIALGGSAAVTALGALRATNAMAAEVQSKIKITINWEGNPSDDDLKFLREVGYKNARAAVPNGGKTTADEMKALKKRYADHGISLDSLQYLPGGEGGEHMIRLLLDLPGRAESVTFLKEWMRRNAEAGLYYVGGNLTVTASGPAARSTSATAPCPAASTHIAHRPWQLAGGQQGRRRHQHALLRQALRL